MRTIQVSTDVFAAIWRERQEDEHSEDAVLRRKFNVPAKTPEPARDLRVEIGFHDPRYGVELAPGFQIFRTYKGKEYRAEAIQGFWFWNGKGYGTLNELNTAIGIAHENAWKAWFFLDSKGRRKPMSELRDQSKIRARKHALAMEDVL